MSAVPYDETAAEPTIVRSSTIRVAIAFTIAIYVFRLVGLFSRFPGTTIDARFNQVALEHLWLWATGRADSLADPSFFYPYPDIFYLSDCHFGSGWIYVIFRAFGAPREVAFDLWFLVGMAATFAAAVYAFRRFGLGATSALFGACVFAFSLPMLAQDAHAQLVYRFAVPLATLALVEFRRAPSLNNLASLTLWVAWQFLCSVYIGVFLVEMLAIVGAVTIAFPMATGAAAAPSRGRDVALAAAALIAVGLAGLMLWRHAEVARLYTIRRDMNEIGQMAPRWTSLVSMAGAPTVGWFSKLLPHHTVFWDWEHQLFPGLGVLLLAGAGARGGWRHPTHRSVVFVCLAAILGLLALVLDVGGHGLYVYLAQAPGLNAIRSPGRVTLVMAFPLAWLAALGLEKLRRSSSRPAIALMIVALGLSLLDIAAFQSATVNIADARARIAAMSAALDGAALRAKRAVLLRFGDDTNEQETMRDLDLMIAAQDMNVATFNGYSGSKPPLWKRPRDCAEARAWIERAERLPFKRAGADELATRAVIVPSGACGGASAK